MESSIATTVKSSTDGRTYLSITTSLPRSTPATTEVDPFVAVFGSEEERVSWSSVRAGQEKKFQEKSFLKFFLKKFQEIQENQEIKKKSRITRFRRDFFRFFFLIQLLGTAYTER